MAVFQTVVTVGSSDFSSLTSVLMPQFAAMREAAQMINDRPARVFAVIVQAADIHEIIEIQIVFGAYRQTSANLFRVGEFQQ